MGRPQRKLLAVAVLVLTAGVAAWYFGARLPGVDPVAFGEQFVHESLEAALAADLEWREIVLSFDPLRVELHDVRAAWPLAPGLRVRATRVVVHPSLSGGASTQQGKLLFGDFQLEGLRIELSELTERAGDRPGSKRVIELRKLLVSPSEKHPKDDAEGFLADGEFASGGEFSLTARDLASGRGLGRELGLELGLAAGGWQIDARFSDVPAGEWAASVPQLENASGTISGELGVKLGAAELGEVPLGKRSLEGHFEIDATRAGLSIAGAYRKPVGDPATLSGRFARVQGGEFELLEAQLSIRKAEPNEEKR